MTSLGGARGWERGSWTLRLLFGGRFLSQAAQSIFFAWLFVESGSGTEGATQLGGAVIAMMLASILLGLPGGALADMLGTRWALPAGSVLRLLAVAAGIAVLGDELWVLAFAYSAASQIFTPAELALVRTVGKQALLGSHAVLLVLQYAGFGVGSLVLFPLLVATGPPLAPLVAAAVLFAAAGIVAFLLGHQLAALHDRERVGLSARAVVDVFSFLWRDPRSLYAAGVLAFADMATRSLLLALPLYLLADLELTTPGIAALSVVAALGGVAGLGWARRQRARASELQLVRTLRAAMVAAIGSTLALAMLADALRLTLSYSRLPTPAEVQSLPLLGFLVALPVFAVLGAALTITPIASRGLLSARAPLAYQARVFAAQGTLSNLLVLFPIAIATAGAELIGSRATLLFVAALGTAALYVLERTLRREATNRGRVDEAARI